MTKRTFKRQESWRLKRVKENWRRPRGGTSRIRLEVSGWPRMPNIGLGKDSTTRGLHPSGLEERHVSHEQDLDGLDPKKHIVRLAHQLGEKKRLALVGKIRHLNVRIANPGAIEAAKPAPTTEQPEEEPITSTAQAEGAEAAKLGAEEAGDESSAETEAADSRTEDNE